MNLEEESTLITRLANILLRCTVPLFKLESNKRPSLVGSGFLVSSGSDAFLVSAAHVLDEYAKLYFYVEPGKTRKLSGRLVSTKLPASGKRIDDRIDVAVLRLGGEGLPPYTAVDKDALLVSALRSNALPRESKQYLVTGFPETRSKANPSARTINSEPVIYRNLSAAECMYEALRVDPETHIAIPLDLQRVAMPDGSIAAFPKPAGLSGSPVWLLIDEVGANDPCQTPIVGVAIEYHKSTHVLIASDVHFVLQLIQAST